MYLNRITSPSAKPSTVSFYHSLNPKHLPWLQGFRDVSSHPKSPTSASILPLLPGLQQPQPRDYSSSPPITAVTQGLYPSCSLGQDTLPPGSTPLHLPSLRAPLQHHSSPTHMLISNLPAASTILFPHSLTFPFPLCSLHSI